jgi:phosphatidylserine/phosphatidylglycerophosphate/cardiolipin synthase-like enzyme
MAHELAEHGRETILRRHMCAHRVDEFLAIFAELEGVRPLHDVQMAVDGEAAAALGELARERWRRATGRPSAPYTSLGAIRGHVSCHQT